MGRIDTAQCTGRGRKSPRREGAVGEEAASYIETAVLGPSTRNPRPCGSKLGPDSDSSSSDG